MRYEVLLERTIDEWSDGYGVIQIVKPESLDQNELRFCYYKNGEYVNRPLTINPEEKVAAVTAKTVETFSSLARTFTADEIRSLVEDLGEERVVELATLVDELGRSRLLEILQET